MLVCAAYYFSRGGSITTPPRWCAEMEICYQWYCNRVHMAALDSTKRMCSIIRTRTT